MFDNNLSASAGPMIVDSDSGGASEGVVSDEPTPVKRPAPTGRKLGPKPAMSKRKIVSSDSEASPVKKKVNLFMK